MYKNFNQIQIYSKQSATSHIASLLFSIFYKASSMKKYVDLASS